MTFHGTAQRAEDEVGLRRLTDTLYDMRVLAGSTQQNAQTGVVKIPVEVPVRAERALFSLGRLELRWLSVVLGELRIRNALEFVVADRAGTGVGPLNEICYDPARKTVTVDASPTPVAVSVVVSALQVELLAAGPVLRRRLSVERRRDSRALQPVRGALFTVLADGTPKTLIGERLAKALSPELRLVVADYRSLPGQCLGASGGRDQRQAVWVLGDSMSDVETLADLPWHGLYTEWLIAKSDSALSVECELQEEMRLVGADASRARAALDRVARGMAARGLVYCVVQPVDDDLLVDCFDEGMAPALVERIAAQGLVVEEAGLS